MKCYYTIGLLLITSIYASDGAVEQQAQDCQRAKMRLKMCHASLSIKGMASPLCLGYQRTVRKVCQASDMDVKCESDDYFDTPIHNCNTARMSAFICFLLNGSAFTHTCRDQQEAMHRLCKHNGYRTGGLWAAMKKHFNNKRTVNDA